jgi:hypothetical protein
MQKEEQGMRSTASPNMTDDHKSATDDKKHPTAQTLSDVTVAHFQAIALVGR